MRVVLRWPLGLARLFRRLATDSQLATVGRFRSRGGTSLSVAISMTPIRILFPV